MKPGLFTTIYMNEMAALGLFGVDMLVYRALCFECRAGAAKIVMKQFAERWRLGDDTTTKRHVDKLIRRGIISETDGLISVVKYPQNENDDSQNENENPQNENKKPQNEQHLNNNINNNNIFSSSASRADEKEKEVLDDSSSKNTSDSEPTYDGIPTWDEAWEYAKNNNITFRETKKFYNYFNAYGWIDKYGRPVKQWASLFQSFVDDLHDRDRQQAARFATRAQSGYPETAWGDRQRAMDARMRDEREVIEGFRARERARRAAEQAAEQAESDQ